MRHLPAFACAALLIAGTASAAGVVCGKNPTDEAGADLEEAVSCVAVGPETLAESPVPDTPTVDEYRKICADYSARLKASGFTMRDIDYLFESNKAAFDKYSSPDDPFYRNPDVRAFACDGGLWRVQVLRGSDWVWLPLPVALPGK